MTQQMLTITFVAALLALMETPARAAECVEAHVLLTAESGAQSAQAR